ncbi:MAG: hypothetical protein DMF66_17220 [Acidobacteria bacterium]|nr:MAG: hypothetical protein DMF66_17220 [Acidobacteriota bacterium]
MYHEQVSPRYYIFGAAWLLLGLVVGLHLPDVDSRLQGSIPSWLLLHRSILTHGCIVPLLLFWLARRRVGTAPSFLLFAVGLSLALAVHLCFDFFPRGWVGFALIHVPVYGRTTALFSQIWIILSIVVCLYVGFRLVRNVLEFALGIGGLIISFGREPGCSPLSPYAVGVRHGCYNGYLARTSEMGDVASLTTRARRESDAGS